MSAVVKLCSRPGCGKELFPTNKSGACTSGCRSPDAPPSLQAVKSHPGRGKKVLISEDADVLVRFRVVATALGKDPDDILREAAQAWLDVVAKAVE